MESNTQRSRPRPRTQKKTGPRTDFSRTDPLKAKDKNARGQRTRTKFYKCSRPQKQKSYRAGNAQFVRNFKQFQKKRKQKKKIIEPVTEVKVKFSLVIFLFHESKISAVVRQRTGRFPGLVGFEVKDLRFEAKDFKMCPRGLHLF